MSFTGSKSPALIPWVPFLQPSIFISVFLYLLFSFSLLTTSFLFPLYNVLFSHGFAHSNRLTPLHQCNPFSTYYFSKNFIEQIEFIEDDTLENMDIFDAAMYLETLNQLEILEEGMNGESYEWNGINWKWICDGRI